MRDIDLGKDFNQREYWKYQLKILLGIYSQIKRVADNLELTDEVVRVMREGTEDDNNRQQDR
jgi:hypothetical protein